jgi:hypothetical protein
VKAGNRLNVADSDTSDTENSDKEGSSSNACNSGYKLQHLIICCNYCKLHRMSLKGREIAA